MDLKRKGDVTISTVILIILGLVVLVMLIIGFTKGTDFLFSWFDKAPGEIQQIAKACVLYAKGSLDIDFCTYRKAGNELVNCNDTRFDSTLTEGGVTNRPDCAANDEKAKRDACKDAKENTRIGQQTCGQVAYKCGPSLNSASVCTGANKVDCEKVEGCKWAYSST